jgi:DNA-binding MarR family transcriptional regulator
VNATTVATQALSSSLLDGVALDAWTSFLRTHAGVTRRLNADLLAVHDLTLNDYEVLLHLSRAPERRLRRVDLVDRLVLTPSGITRLLEGLERSGYVSKAACESDARVTYAVLTDAGHEKLRAAARTHVAGIREQFADRFSDDELATLAALLGRLPVAADKPEACEP